MTKADELSKEIWKQCPNIDKNALLKKINSMMKEAIDSIIDDPYADALFSNEGYYLLETPKKQFKIYRPLINHIPDNWSVIMPSPANSDIYDKKGVLREKFWKLPAIRHIYDIHNV